MRHIMLDTDACIEIIRGRSDEIEKYRDSSLCISAISRFELLSGIRKRKSRKLANRGAAFLGEIACFTFDEEASESAAKIRIDLEANGEKIGAYDTLIAGHCLALKRELLTGNLKEFSRVKGLKLLPWWD